MSESGEWTRIECEALPDNVVRLSIQRGEGESTLVDLPASEVANVASALLSAVASAGKQAGAPTQMMSGGSLEDVPDAKPTGLGIIQGKAQNSAAIVLQFGSARIALRMADQELAALGQALGTFSASSQRLN
jgi:hypothetical protein